MVKLAEKLRRLVHWFLRRSDTCGHVDLIQNVEATPPDGCEECLLSGDSWVHLRRCLICGHVGCCDMSKNKHATKHFSDTGHPLIQSAEEGEEWIWCYIDEVVISAMD